MSEEAEIPQQEEVVSSPELRQEISSAQAEIRERLADPVQQAASRIKELGLLGAMKEAYWPHAKKIFEVTAWKDPKVKLMAVLNILPIIGHSADVAKAVGEIGRAQKAAKAAEKTFPKILSTVSKGTETAEQTKKLVTAARHVSGEHVQAAIEKAKGILDAKQLGIFENATARGASAYEALHYAQQGAITMTRTEGVKHFVKDQVKHTVLSEALNVLNPYPDVPHAVHQAASTIGLLSWIPHPVTQVARFAHLVPVAWQWVHNQYELAKEGIGAVKDVGTVLRAQVETMVNNQKKPDVAQAAKAFQPA